MGYGKGYGKEVIDTPYGNKSYELGNGITFFDTESHGYFAIHRKDYLSGCKKEEIPPCPYLVDNKNEIFWFEADHEWAYLALAIPESFSADELRSAYETLAEFDPEYLEECRKFIPIPGH